MSRLWQPAKCDRAVRLGYAVAVDAPSDPWSEGYAAGRATAEDEFAAERAVLGDLAMSIEALVPPSREVLSMLIADTVARLVAQVAGEAAVDMELLTARAEAAAAAIGDEDGVRLVFHLEDVALLDATRFDVEIVSDASLARGNVRAESTDAWARDGVDEALSRMGVALGLRAA